MECDSTHSVIQKKLIFLLNSFSMLRIRENLHFHLTPITLLFLPFFYYDCLPKLYSSIRPGKKAGDPTVNKIRALGYDPSGTIYFKTNIKEEYAIIPHRSAKNNHNTELFPLHIQRLKISKKKWEHLNDLKVFIPEDCHDFYTNLPHENE